MLGKLIKNLRNKPSPPPKGEIATISGGRDITRGFTYGLLEPQDRILWLEGHGNYEIYEDIHRDDQVFSTFQQRRLAVTSREWDVEPGGRRAIDRKAADFIKEVCDHIGFDNLTEKMLFGRFYGWKVAECIWARDGRNVYPEAIKVKSNRRFKFWEDGSLRLLTTQQPLGEVLPERKFWVFSCGGDHDDEPYGLGLAHYLYWLVFYKRNDLSFWSIFLEKFGQPTALGRYPTAATTQEQGKLLQALQAIQVDSGIILPEGMLIDFLEASRSGTADYSTFYDVLNKGISKIVLGQTMTTDDGSSRSQAEVHNGVKKEIVKADADLTCESFNDQIVRWLTDWNYPGAAYARVWRNLEDSEDLNKRAERENIIKSWGFKPKLSYVIETYGGEWEEEKKEKKEQNLDVFGQGKEEEKEEDETPNSEEEETRFSEETKQFTFNYEGTFEEMLCDIRDALQYMRFGASEEELIELSEVLKAELIVVEILSFSDNVVDFAAKGKQKKRKCTKGYNCGGSCITRKKNCRKALKGEAKNAAEWLRMQLHGKGGTGASGEGKAKKANEAKAKKDNSSKGLMKSGEDFLENSERKAIDDYFEAQKTLDSRKSKINDVREQLYREYGAELVKSGGEETEGVKKTRKKLDAKTKELDRLDDDLSSKQKKAEEAMENVRQRVIKNRGISEKELNDYVNSLNIDKKVLNDNPKIREQIKEYVAMTGFKSKRMKGLDITSDRAHAEAHKNSGIVNTGRSQTEKAKKETLFHEMSHFYEAEKPEMRKAANEWRDRKAKDYS
ncbi:MAG: DUF935 family protein, partial [Spirulina sp.]